jgi:hypothetical protein
VWGGEPIPDSLVGPFAIVALILALLALLLSLVVFVRVWRLSRRGKAGSEARGEIELLGDLRGIESKLAAIASRLERLEGQGRLAVQRVGVVRYNPFEDTGSNQSFALALLDGNNDGLVLSSLHSRQQTRVFLKPIVRGRCEIALSGEETEALRKAGLTS